MRKNGFSERKDQNDLFQVSVGGVRQCTDHFHLFHRGYGHGGTVSRAGGIRSACSGGSGMEYKKDVIYAGIVADHLEAWEEEYQKEYQMKFLTPDQLAEDSGPLLDWLRENGYKHVMIHWDLDVISPADFRSLLCAEPHIPPVEYAVGEMTLDQILRLIKDVSAEFDVVALGITEFLPWDIIRLQKGLGELSIFHE